MGKAKVNQPLVGKTFGISPPKVWRHGSPENTSSKTWTRIDPNPQFWGSIRLMAEILHHLVCIEVYSTRQPSRGCGLPVILLYLVVLWGFWWPWWFQAPFQLLWLFPGGASHLRGPRFPHSYEDPRVHIPDPPPIESGEEPQSLWKLNQACEETVRLAWGGTWTF